MPGMMDTILNLGLNDVAVEAVAAKTQQPPLCLRQLSPFHSDVLGCRYGHRQRSKFEAILDEAKEKKGVKLDTELDADDLKKVVVKL